MERDRNLLFGIFAVQLRKVTPSQLMEIAGAWAVDPSHDIGDRLVETGLLSNSDRALLDGFVSDAVRAHEGNSLAALMSFGGERQVHETFRGTIALTESGGVLCEQVRQADTLDGSFDSVPGVQEAPARYTHLSEYARGGMGRILLVHDKHLARDIALKELLPETESAVNSPNPSPVRLSVPLIARFLQEARITGQLEHPSIVPVYELGYRKDGTLYYTMKLVRGETLAETLRKTRTLKDRLALLPHLIDLCHSIAYAHSRSVIHRDIKPENVMIGAFGETVVIDWGLAKAKDRHDVHLDGMQKTFHAIQMGDERPVTKTAYGHALGTPAYMCPEQARGKLEEIDERSDIYSLGAVLYELLTGRPPFSGNTVYEVIQRAVQAEPEPVAKLAPDAPPELVAICERAMQKSPEHRYQSAKELAEEIGRFLSGALVRAHEYRLSEHLGRLVRKHAAVLTVGLLSVFLLVMVSVLYVRNVIEERNHAEAARYEAEQARQDAEARAYAGACLRLQKHVSDKRYDLATKMLAQLAPEQRAWEWGYLKGLVAPKPILMDPDAKHYVWTTDRTKLAVGSESHIALWDLTAEKETAAVKTSAAPNEKLLHYNWSPDGKYVVASYAAASKAVQGLDEATSHYRTDVIDAHTNAVLYSLEGHVALLIDTNSTRLLTHAMNQPQGQSLTLRDLRTGKQEAEFHGAKGARYIVWDYDEGQGLFVAGRADGIVDVVSLDTLSEVRSIPAHETAGKNMGFPGTELEAQALSAQSKAITWLDLQCAGSSSPRLAVASFDGSVRVLDLASGEQLWEQQHEICVLKVCFDPTGSRLAVLPQARMQVLVYDTTTRELLFQTTGHSGYVFHMEFSRNGEKLVTGSRDGTCRIWNAASGAEELTLHGGTEEMVYMVDFGPKDWQVVAATPQGVTYLNTQEQESIGNNVLANLPGWEFDSVDFSSDGTLLLAGSHRYSEDRTQILQAFHIVSAASGEIIHSYELTPLQAPAKEPHVGVSYAPRDSNSALVVPTGNEVQVRDLTSGDVRVRIQSPARRVWRASFSPDGACIATVDWGGMVRLWDAKTGTLIREMDVSSPTDPEDATFGPDGATLVTGDDTNWARVWRVEDGQRTHTLKGHENWVNRTLFSPDGTIIGTASWDQTLKLWDAYTGSLVRTLEGHAAPLVDFAFHPDGSRISSAARDGQIIVWDVRTGAALLELVGPKQGIAAIDISPDGLQIAAASSDGSVRMWRAHPWQSAE